MPCDSIYSVFCRKRLAVAELAAEYVFKIHIYQQLCCADLNLLNFNFYMTFIWRNNIKMPSYNVLLTTGPRS